MPIDPPNSPIARLRAVLRATHHRPDDTAVLTAGHDVRDLSGRPVEPQETTVVTWRDLRDIADCFPPAVSTPERPTVIMTMFCRDTNASASFRLPEEWKDALKFVCDQRDVATPEGSEAARQEFLQLLIRQAEVNQALGPKFR